jgi:class 3 adenylate cyclase/TolB-like protein
MLSEVLASVGSAARIVRTILVVDIVESVRLIEQHEEETIARWRAFLDHVVGVILPAHEGRLVKSTGDGMMLEFPHVLSAIRAAFDIQRASFEANRDLPVERRMLLRIGAHVGSIIVDERDVYGHGVNLAARLATLAGPGEIVASADVRDLLTPMVDAEIEDLGECYLKHVANPVRAYRIGATGDRPVIDLGVVPGDLRATVAVIPFSPRSHDPQQEVIGQVLADDVISALSRSTEVNVVSRLSTTVFQGRELILGEIRNHLRADYVLSGSYDVVGERLVLRAELADAHSQQVAWSSALKGRVKAIVTGDDPLPDRLVAEVCKALTLHELQRSEGKALPTLESHTLLLSSIALMHRMSPAASERARQYLQALIERTPRLAAPYAWQAKWHVLRVTQGWSEDPQLDGRLALNNTKRALDLDKRSSLAMTVEGQVNTYILKRFDVAQERYAAALRENPNDSLAWLLKGTLHAFRGEGEAAVGHTGRALKLSPLDPLRYYYESLAATAAISAGQYQRALKLAERSFRLNRTHASTLRVMVVALWQLGRRDEARAAAAEVLKLDPAFRISTFLERSPGAQFEIGRFIANTLEQAGIPK